MSVTWVTRTSQGAFPASLMGQLVWLLVLSTERLLGLAQEVLAEHSATMVRCFSAFNNLPTVVASWFLPLGLDAGLDSLEDSEEVESESSEFDSSWGLG